MKFWRRLDLCTQVGRGSEQKPGIRISADGNLSLTSSFPRKASGAQRTAVGASAIPLRKCSAGGRAKNLHPHAASLAADARSVRFSADRHDLNPISCSASKSFALLPQVRQRVRVATPEIAARFPGKARGQRTISASSPHLVLLQLIAHESDRDRPPATVCIGFRVIAQRVRDGQDRRGWKRRPVVHLSSFSQSKPLPPVAAVMRSKTAVDTGSRRASCVLIM